MKTKLEILERIECLNMSLKGYYPKEIKNDLEFQKIALLWVLK